MFPPVTIVREHVIPDCAMIHQSLDGHRRWTVDLSSKHGRATANDELVSGNALSITYDDQNIFFRLSKDRKVNFTAEDQTRVSVGLRF